MKLDYNPKNGRFVLFVPRNEHEDVNTLRFEHGLNFSITASTVDTCCLFTDEPYAAVTFYDQATAAAKAELETINREISTSWKAESKGHFRVPPDQELWPFQKANLEYALKRQHTLIADQPGLGKTPTAIAYCNEIGAKRVLVLCPANIRLQWAKKIHEWSTMPWPVRVHCILNGRHGVDDSAAWTVCSYDLARTPAIARALARTDYDVLIIDEAHFLKTPDSLRTRAVFGGGNEPVAEPIASRCAHVLALTGTPLPNRPREAYTLARNLCWDAVDWLSEAKFRERFNPSRIMEGRGGGKYIDERTGRHSELQNRLRANFMTRHLKRQVMTQLQMPAYDIIQLEENGPIRAALKAESMLHINPEDLTGADATILGHIAVVRRQMGIAMAPQVASYVDMLLDGGEEKLVIFAWHIEVLNILQTALAKWGVLRIDGSTSPTHRQAIVEKFQEDPSINVIIGNIQSMGVGTDGLQNVSNHALIAEPSWTPGDNQQACDRLDRGGQNRTVQCDFFAVPNSFAERILASSLRKNSVIHSALDAQGLQKKAKR